MQTVLTGQANILGLPLVAKTSGNPIVSGTVNFYLVDKDGANADKWYRGSDQSWQVAESIAGTATHRVDGHWYLSFPSAVWSKNIRYRLYAKESGNLHIPVGEDVLEISETGLVDDAITAAKYDESTAFPVSEKQSKAASTMELGLVVADAGNSTTQFKTNLTEVTGEHYNGRVVLWVTGSMLRQGTDIVDYDGTNKILHVVAMTEIPSEGAEFIIV